jgi:hypothetical protein
MQYSELAAYIAAATITGNLPRADARDAKRMIRASESSRQILNIVKTWINEYAGRRGKDLHKIHAEIEHEYLTQLAE